jgi:hypothetical protein
MSVKAIGVAVITFGARVVPSRAAGPSKSEDDDKASCSKGFRCA